MRVLLTVSLVLSFAALSVGCKPEPPPEPKEKPPPPPTAEELYSQIKQKLGPFYQAYQQKSHIAGNAGQTIEDFRTGKGQFTAAENGREALSRAQRDIEQWIKWARDEERYRWVKTAIQLYKVFQPGTQRYKSLERRADLMLARPKVTVKGFFELDGDLYAFLECTDPDTNEVTQYKVREGEEFHEVLRLIRIIGDNQAVELLYIPANDTWVVKGIAA